MSGLVRMGFVRSRGRVSCNICLRVITAGTLYRDAVTTTSSNIWHWRTCPICEPVEHAFVYDPFLFYPDEYDAEDIEDYAACELSERTNPPGYLVTWWRHTYPNDPLPVEALLATEGVDL